MILYTDNDVQAWSSYLEQRVLSIIGIALSGTASIGKSTLFGQVISSYALPCN